MDQVGSLLPKVLKKRGLMEHATSSLVVQKAQSWLHEKLPQLADHVKVAKFADNEVRVEVTHSIAAQECQQLAEELLEYLKKETDISDETSIRVLRE